MAELLGAPQKGSTIFRQEAPDVDLGGSLKTRYRASAFSHKHRLHV